MIHNNRTICFKRGDLNYRGLGMEKEFSLNTSFYVLIFELCDFINYSKIKYHFNIVYILNTNQMLLNTFKLFCNLLFFTTCHTVQVWGHTESVVKSTDFAAPGFWV